MVEKVGEIHNASGLLISLFLYILLFIFQSAVLSHFLYKIHGRELSIKIKFTTLCVLLVTWLGICFEFAIVLLNISNALSVETAYCSIVIWFKYTLFIIFEFTLYMFWLMRIYHTFKFSVFEIKRQHVIIIICVISTVCLAFLIVISLSMQPQYKEINVSLSPQTQFLGFDCVPKWHIIPIWIVYIIGQIVTLIFNLFFAALFFHKLKALQKVNDGELGAKGDAANARKLRLFQLTQKHTLLALVSVFTSIICWVLFDAFAISSSNAINQDMLVILSLDRVVKSLCIILMFKFYEEIFSKICCLCLRTTNIRCMCAKVKRLFPYFDPIREASIYQCSPDMAELEDVYGEDISINESVIRELEGKTPPDRPLPPKSPKHLHVLQGSLVHSTSREVSVSKSKSYEKALPQVDFSVKPYKMRNFLACLSDTQGIQSRYLDYSAKGYYVIPSSVFNTINEECTANQGVVIMKDLQSNRKFSFLQKTKTMYPYQLAIRLKDHDQHLHDASKLLKYAEYELNQRFQTRKASSSATGSFDYEDDFDRIATELASGKLTHGGNQSFMVFNGSARGFGTPQPSRTPSPEPSGDKSVNRLHIHAGHSKIRNLSVEDIHSNKPLPPITPPLSSAASNKEVPPAEWRS